MEKIHETCMFLYFHVNFKLENTKHACFHVNFPFSAYFYPSPHYITMVKGLFLNMRTLDFE